MVLQWFGAILVGGFLLNAHLVLQLPLGSEAPGCSLLLQGGATYFCVTPLAASLCGGSSSGTATVTDGGRGAEGDQAAFIIVETNFRVSSFPAHAKTPTS